MFEDGITFSMLKKLCKYELLRVFKEIYNLSKKELNHINNFVENFNFTEKEIEYLEKIVKKYAKEFELLKVEQEFDIFEKAQLNHAEISKAVNKQSRKV